MKKFVLKLIPFVILCLLVTVLFPLLLDPYNVFHVMSIRDNGVEPNKNYIKMSYIINEPDRFDAYFFGSSRVGAFHTEKLNGCNCYNMTYSVGLPVEFKDNLKTMIDKGVSVKRIYVGLDSASYTYVYEGREQDPLRASYEYLTAHPAEFCKLYLESAKTFRSIPTIVKNKKTEGYAERFYSYGWPIDYGIKPMETYGGLPEISVGPAEDPYGEMEKELQAIKEMKEICDDNGIEFIVITMPMLWITYNESVDKLYYTEFMKRLSEITDYYNFSGLNEITRDQNNYFDPSHFGAEIGDIVLSCLNGQEVPEELYEDGFGWYVTEENIDELLNVLEAGKVDKPE